MINWHKTDARRAKSMQKKVLEKKTKKKVHTVLHCLDDDRCMRLQEDLSHTTTNSEFKAVKHYLIWT